MKTELAMNLIAKVVARGGEQGGKGKSAKAGGFDEALAARVDAKTQARMPQARRADQADEARPQWRIGGLGERLAFAMPRQEPAGDEAPDLGGFLQPVAAETPVRDEPEMADDVAVVAAAPQAEPDAAEPFDGIAAAPAAAPRIEPAAPELSQDAAPASEPQVEETPRAARHEPAPTVTAAPITAASTTAAPAVAAAPVAAAETQPRPRVERGQPAQPAPVADAAAGDADGEPATTRAPVAVVAAVMATDSPPANPAPAEPVRRPTVAAAPEPAQARPAAPRADAPVEQQRPPPAPGAAPPRAEAPAAARTVAPAAERTAAPASQVAEAANGAQPRVTVLGIGTAAPAPVMLVPLNPTAAGLVTAIEADPTWRAAAAEAASTAAQRGPGQGSISTLRIQLNPAELGMVTARLSVAGPQLEIEIRVESNDARQRLANDGDAIVKALRALGFDIDKVTIQQAPQTGGQAPQQGGQGRDSFLNGHSNERADANAGGRDGQGSESGNGAGRRGAGEAAAERPGGGVYI